MLLDNFYTILSSESSDSTIWTIQIKLNLGILFIRDISPNIR